MEYPIAHDCLKLSIASQLEPQLVPKLWLLVLFRELHNRMLGPPKEGRLKKAIYADNIIIISDSTLCNVLSPQLKKMTSWYKVWYSCECYISAKIMQYPLLTWHNSCLKQLKNRSHNAQNRMSGKYQVMYLKPKRMLYSIMVVVFTIPQHTYPWNLFVPLHLNIMRYYTENVCYVVAISAQLLFYTVRRQIKIQQTCVQQ